MTSFPQIAFDAACILSILGIWPRFIEPSLLKTTSISCPIPRLPSSLEGFRILHFSDLHIGPHLTDRMLRKVETGINRTDPDLALFTGDFLCYSILSEPERLKDFLNGIQAKFGHYAIFGNHDYAKPGLVDPASGRYRIGARKKSDVAQGLKLLARPVTPSGEVPPGADKVPFHPELMDVLAQTPFRLLHNETCRISNGSGEFNLVGLGEHIFGKDDCGKAMETYDPELPGVILCHNPDSLPKCLNGPATLFLSGHTHGAQINLPWIRERLTPMENPRLRRGVLRENGKTIVINRGIGSVFPFRLFSPPELSLITLTGDEL